MSAYHLLSKKLSIPQILAGSGRLHINVHADSELKCTVIRDIIYVIHDYEINRPISILGVLPGQVDSILGMIKANKEVSFADSQPSPVVRQVVKQSPESVSNAL